MPIIITNFILPLALSILRSYLYNSSTKHDDKLLKIAKDAVLYFSYQTSQSLTPKELSKIVEVPQFADLKGGL